MPSITVRNIPEEVRRGLRERAARHGRSTEAEVREILANAAKPEGRVKLGTLLRSIGREAGLTRAGAEGFDRLRSKESAQPLDLG
ncbi:MAG TPA: Arc family DNA-binding protein [Nevskiaceae bacterium]|nr:Arc family DNA-binding protein [Nevskiaceae bacterium]